MSNGTNYLDGSSNESESVRLNRMWSIYKDKVEKELNQNCSSFGEVDPGHIYRLPIVVAFQKDLSGPPQAGFIKDFHLPLEKANTTIEFKKMFGYAACMRLALLNDQNEFERRLKLLTEEIKLSLKHNLTQDHHQPGYGFYAKFSPFQDEENWACYSFTITSNWIPMIQIGRDPKNVNLR